MAGAQEADGEIRQAMMDSGEERRPPEGVSPKCPCPMSAGFLVGSLCTVAVLALGLEVAVPQYVLGLWRYGTATQGADASSRVRGLGSRNETGPHTVQNDTGDKCWSGGCDPESLGNRLERMYAREYSDGAIEEHVGDCRALCLQHQRCTSYQVAKKFLWTNSVCVLYVNGGCNPELFNGGRWLGSSGWLRSTTCKMQSPPDERPECVWGGCDPETWRNQTQVFWAKGYGDLGIEGNMDDCRAICMANPACTSYQMRFRGNWYVLGNWEYAVCINWLHGACDLDQSNGLVWLSDFRFTDVEGQELPVIVNRIMQCKIQGRRADGELDLAGASSAGAGMMGYSSAPEAEAEAEEGKEEGGEEGEGSKVGKKKPALRKQKRKPPPAKPAR